MAVVPDEQQLPAQRAAAAVVAAQAAHAWWAPGHPGWMIFTLEGRHFDSLDEAIQVPPPLPQRSLLSSHGFCYLEVHSEFQLTSHRPTVFFGNQDNPVHLAATLGTSSRGR